MKPSISRNVHFVDESGKHRAAIVTDVRADGKVDLAVFAFRGVRNVDGVEEGLLSGTWHWPEREEEKPAAKPK